MYLQMNDLLNIVTDMKYLRQMFPFFFFLNEIFLAKKSFSEKANLNLGLETVNTSPQDAVSKCFRHRAQSQWLEWVR